MKMITGILITLLATLLLFAVIWLSVGYKDVLNKNAKLEDDLRYARYDNTLRIIRPDENLGRWTQDVLWKSSRIGNNKDLNEVFQMRIDGQEVDFSQSILEVSQSKFEAYITFKHLRLKEE